MAVIAKRPTSRAPAKIRSLVATLLPSLRILLAEDNAVNQKLVVHLLEKDGHIVTVASNGREALEALELADYDLVLMDVQMPEMSGFEATASIRKREKTSGGHLPVIALTAHAMKGDQDRCLKAGMDAYVSKPIQREELLKAMETVLMSHKPGCPEVAGPVASEKSEATHPDPESLDMEVLLGRVDGDRELLQEIIEVYLEEYPRMLQEIRDAVGQSDSERLRIAAHTLKGAVANFGAKAAVQAAQELETMGKSGNVGQAAETLDKLEDALTWLLPALEELRFPGPVMQVSEIQSCQ